MSHISSLHGQLMASVIEADLKLKLEKIICHKLVNKVFLFCCMIHSIRKSLGGKEWESIELFRVYLTLKQDSKYLNLFLNKVNNLDNKFMLVCLTFLDAVIT